MPQGSGGRHGVVARHPVGPSCKRTDHLDPSPFRRPQAQGCGDRLRPGFGEPRIGA